MTIAKVPKIACQPLAIALLVSTLAVFITVAGLFPATPSTTTVVTKKIAHLPSAFENSAVACVGGLANINLMESVPWSRTKWQTPPALLPDMVPFRGKKGDQAYDRYILSAADRYDMDPAVIKAVIMAESGFNPQAVSRAGARGLMQLMPRTASALGVKDALDPQANIMGGTRYLKKLMNRFDNDIELALAAYNAGSRNVRKHNGIPPFKATHRYIAKIKLYYQHYQDQKFDITG
jgi:soluble lytic murein transglycosylase-like protein